MNPIPVSLAAEGALDEVVLRRLLALSGRKFAPGVCYGKRGKGHLRQNIGRFNQAARHVPFIVLADLDDEDCAPGMLNRWLPQGRNSNLILRIAVKEVESWLLADSRRLAAFLGIRATTIPDAPDNHPEPKALLVNLARDSRKPAIRDDLVPSMGSTSRVGRNYVGLLSYFISKQWRADLAARARSPSLDKALTVLERFSPSFS